MDRTTLKRKPALTAEEQERLRQEIIDVGRELFASKGTYGFSTRALAKRLNMSHGNLYNYFQSKRELWIAIREQDLKELKRKMEEIINSHKGDILSLDIKLVEYFLDFAHKEKHKFQLMFMIPEPPSKEVGPIEENYEVIDPLDILRKFLKKGMDEGVIKKMDIDLLNLYCYAMSVGAALVESHLRLRDKIFEPLNKRPSENIIKKFRKFLIERSIETYYV